MKTARIVDANVNRCSEALRVLEDAARFVLEDLPLAAKAKTWRHRLSALAAPSKALLLAARRSDEDRGAFLDPDTEMTRRDMESLLRANCKRAQQALRSLEEYAKLPESPRMDAAALKRLRFACYAFEKDLQDKLSRRSKRPLLRGLYLVLDPQTKKSDVLKTARKALAGGVRLIQFRDKTGGKARQLKLCRSLKKLTAAAGALFFVNDHVDVALLSEADGVHLGQGDLPIAEARRLLPPGTLIGSSVHGVAEARRAQKDGADYISVGCLFPTLSKTDVRPTSLETLKQIRRAVKVPLCGIGGIGPANAAAVAKSGADMAAVIGAVAKASDPLGAIRSMRKALALIVR